MSAFTLVLSKQAGSGSTAGSSSFSTCEGIASLSPKDFQPYPIKRITRLSHNTKAYELLVINPPFAFDWFT